MSDSAQTTPAERLESLASLLVKRFGQKGCEVLRGFGEVTLIVPAKQLLEVAQTLRDDEAFDFAQLIDLCGVDFGAYGQSEWETEAASAAGFGRGADRDGVQVQDSERRYAVAYHVLSISHNLRLRLRVYATGELPAVDSVVRVWSCADWFEREAFDMFGILFRGHPDLRRILTDYGFIGHPFRKDFPLIGQVEMRYDPAQGRVLYEPVSVEPRTGVARVIRSDNRHLGEAEPKPEQQDAGHA
jgi:NADH-quinone oxidoreductase subunit C